MSDYVSPFLARRALRSQNEEQFVMDADDKLLKLFVRALATLDDMTATHNDPPPDELLVGIDPDDWNTLRWRPTAIETSREHLAEIYDRLPAQFPPLYERFVLTYRWLHIHLDTIELLANPPDTTLGGLAENIFRDPAFVDVLLPAGFVPIAKYWSYDPICFNLNALRKDGDCPLIQFEHEAILCNLKIGEFWPRFASFRDFVCDTIQSADSQSI